MSMRNSVQAFLATAFLVASCQAVTAADIAEEPEAPAAVVAAKDWYDVSFGVKFSTDYVLRGITQTAGKPNITGYAELSLFDWAYAGIRGWNVKYPQRFGLADPSSEIDLYGGLRHAWGALTLDVGYIYYWFPGEAPGAREIDFWKVYGRFNYKVGDIGSIGGNVFWTPDNLNTGANVVHSSALGRIDLLTPSSDLNIGIYTSGELGRRWIGRNDFGFKGPDYTFWNLGLAATHKAVTLDFRYHDTNLDRTRCALASRVESWCGDRYVLSLSFDTSLSKLK